MELEEAKKALNKYREELWKDNKGVEEYAESGEDLEKIDAIDTVISELVALQNLLDEKKEELDRLQKENKSIKARVDKYIQGGNETLRLEHEETLKYYHENYISKDKIRENIEKIKHQLTNKDFTHDMYMGTEQYNTWTRLCAKEEVLQDLLKEE